MLPPSPYTHTEGIDISRGGGGGGGGGFSKTKTRNVSSLIGISRGVVLSWKKIPSMWQTLMDIFWSTTRLGSITSRCSGNEPPLLPRTHGWTRQFPFVGFNQSEQCPHNFVGHKLSRQFGLRHVMADEWN